jgi:hypothetical protein
MYESSYIQLMKAADSQPSLAPLRPHSRTFRRGAIGATIDGRSREGRYLRAIEADLIEHAGGAPSTTQKILIHRCARLMLRLELFDERLTAGELTAHDARVYNALQNSLRLALRELGVKGKAEKAPSLRDYLAAKSASRASGEAAKC